MERWTRDEALKWADRFEPIEGLPPFNDQMAFDALAREVRRLHARVERLRGLCKSASGWLLDAGDIDNSEAILGLVGDMEAPLVTK